MKHGLYVEVEPVILKFLREKGVHIFYFCGGRGIGKTYGALDFCRKLAYGEIKLDEKQERNKFLYIRRTGVEAQSVSRPEASPFKAYNTNEGYNINAEFSGKLGFGTFFSLDKDENGELTIRREIGYCAALSTFANLRGVDFSDVNFILYDECIPENKNKHPLKDEGFLFLNMLETINRNRIIEGREEVVVCLLSNAIDLGADFLSQLQLTPILNSMIFKNQQKYTDVNRSLHIEKYKDHKVSKLKEQSAIYKFSEPLGFKEASLSGDFVANDLTVIKKVNLSEYTAFLSLENVCVYKHKSENLYYISQVMNHAEYTFRAYEKEKVRTIFYWLYKLLVIERKVFYDNFSTKVVFEDMINFKPLS